MALGTAKPRNWGAEAAGSGDSSASLRSLPAALSPVKPVSGCPSARMVTGGIVPTRVRIIGARAEPRCWAGGCCCRPGAVLAHGHPWVLPEPLQPLGVGPPSRRGRALPAAPGDAPLAPSPCGHPVSPVPPRGGRSLRLAPRPCRLPARCRGSDRCRGQAMDQSLHSKYRGTTGRCMDLGGHTGPVPVPPARKPPGWRERSPPGTPVVPEPPARPFSPAGASPTHGAGRCGGQHG